jgi:hypothetical protein
MPDRYLPESSSPESPICSRCGNEHAPYMGGSGPERPCRACGRSCGGQCPDPCLGVLPGVSYACCGHGEKPAYVRFENGVTVRSPRLLVDGVTNHECRCDGDWPHFHEDGKVRPCGQDDGCLLAAGHKGMHFIDWSTA